MSRREYTQTVKPVSRIPEKIFGWLAWLSLLAIALFSLFQLLVTANNPEFITQMKTQLNSQIQSNQEFADMFNQFGMSVDEFVPALITYTWYFLAYTVLPIVVGLLGLLMMKKRILAGILLLLAGLLTTIFFFTIFLGFIPLFFFIAAILLFARKDKVITNNDYYEEKSYEERDHATAPAYVERDAHIEKEKSYAYDADEAKTEPVKETTYEHDPHKREDVESEYVSSERVETDFDNNHDGDKDRVTYVDNTKRAVDERRENYNNRR
ncbi:DUF4064 domain-containing protein [Macrococcus armenti]|uniref:DUF4064 domain-containing protein n=1 Tax=Macrococcus armenti TaxID=2875764 RepID=UPI001CCCEFC0|nr:DUF4064 domain-containing protein [Macrococcus armenti]UBH23148.1 DUF4064 domain-containing protein [Macrococcus armenti]